MATTTSNGNGKVTSTGAGNDLVVYGRQRAMTRQTHNRVGDPLSEIGTTGLRQYGGFVQEEWAAQLQGKRGAWAYREMMDNSAVIGGILYAIEMLARQVDWWIEGSTEKMPRGGMLATEFVESCMHDMENTWGDTISEFLSFLPYGWSFHEEVYKRRLGEDHPLPAIDSPESSMSETEEDVAFQPDSKFEDGMIGWRKLAVRAQETLLRWDFTGYAGLRAMEQVDWHGGQHLIPIEKALLFRTKALRGNPEGRSILRNAWQAYYFIQNIQNIEAIGIERDLAGLPVITPPEGVDLYAPQHAELLAQVKLMITSVRRDENEGVILPRAGWQFELVSSGGSRQMNTDDVLRRYRQEMAASMLADFFLVGLDGLGSYAMVDVKSDIFGLAMDATLDIVCDIFNRYAIPRLMRLNGATIKDKPRLCHSSAGRIDLERVGQFLYQLAGAGGPIPWSKEMIAQLFQQAGLPANFDGEDTQLEAVPKPQAGATADEQDSQGKRVAPGHEPAPKKELTKASHRVTGSMAERHKALSVQLEREMNGALGALGQDAATAYMAIPEERSQRPAQVAASVMKQLNVKQWFQDRIDSLIANHAGRVAGDTRRVLVEHIGPEMRTATIAKREPRFRPSNISPQVRAAIVKAITDGRKQQEAPQQIAQRIRDYVPAGRFSKAGSQYRASMIARNETARMQRESLIESYKASPDIHSVRLVDGIYGPPRSDSACIDRNGEVVPLNQVDQVAPYHPLCTLSFDPVG